MARDIWLRLDQHCPECGRYGRKDLGLLASMILGWEDDYEAEDRLVVEFLGMPVGVVLNYLDHDIVRVQTPEE